MLFPLSSMRRETRTLYSLHQTNPYLCALGPSRQRCEHVEVGDEHGRRVVHNVVPRYVLHELRGIVPHTVSHVTACAFSPFK